MTLLYILLAIIVLLAILSFVLPNKYIIEKSLLIPASVETVFANVADLNHYKAWNPWQKTEPGATYEFEGNAASIGQKYCWDGKKIGKGSLTLNAIETNKYVHYHLNFIRPFKSNALDNWKSEAINDNECNVTWYNEGALAVGLPRLFGPIIKPQLEKQFIQGLQNLKEYSCK